MPRILPLDPATYQRHPIHLGDRTWAETNCYTDVIIELLHGLGHEPRAALAFTLGIDFDLDQWTFFKPPPGDLEQLYGLAIYELAPWRPLAEHIAEQVEAGRPVLVEVDSFFLPDTAGTAYQREHVKSTIAVNEIDLERAFMGYFHNQGYHAVEGADFDQLFQIGGLVHERMLPPYIEFVKAIPRWAPLDEGAQTEVALGLWRKHLGRAPEANPFTGFEARMAQDQAWLSTAEIEVFHAYSFATLRQYGANFELCATGLGWLGAQGVDGLDAAASCFERISKGTKVLQFQLARAMMRRRAMDLGPLREMGVLWEQGKGLLGDRLGR